MDEYISILLSLDFKPGDLVTLREDHDISLGYGLILAIKRDLSDIKDLDIIQNILQGNFVDEIYPSKPHLLINWGKINKDIWMYSSDVIIYKKENGEK